MCLIDNSFLKSISEKKGGSIYITIKNIYILLIKNNIFYKNKALNGGALAIDILNFNENNKKPLIVFKKNYFFFN